MIDLSTMTETDARTLSASCLEAVNRFYDDPKNREAFERWLLNTKKRKSNGGKRK